MIFRHPYHPKSKASKDSKGVFPTLGGEMEFNRQES